MTFLIWFFIHLSRLIVAALLCHHRNGGEPCSAIYPRVTTDPACSIRPRRQAAIERIPLRRPTESKLLAPVHSRTSHSSLSYLIVLRLLGILQRFYVLVTTIPQSLWLLRRRRRHRRRSPHSNRPRRRGDNIPHH